MLEFAGQHGRLTLPLDKTMPQLDMIRYLPKLFFKSGSLPLYLTYFVTNKCNLYCEHCFYSASLNQRIEDLKLDEIEKMTKTLDPFPVLLYSGGEPFLRKDLPEITALFYKNCRVRYFSIPTNGLLYDATLSGVSRICELSPDAAIVVNFSIDGLEEEHNRIRGSDRSFRSAIASFEGVKELKKRYKNLRVGFITTLTATNQDHMDEIYSYLKSLKPDNVSVNLIRGTPKNPIVKNVDISKFRAITERIRHDLMDDSLPGYDDFLATMGGYKYEQILKTLEKDRYQTVCYASQIAGVIYPSGDVYPCELLGEDKKIGNLRDYGMDFRRLWRSKRNREIAKWIQESRCFCTHECNVHCNTAFHPVHFTKISAGTVFMKVKKLFSHGEKS